MECLTTSGRKEASLWTSLPGISPQN
jgi:hypothetical protein